MDDQELLLRLDGQERLLHLIVAALAPETEPGTTGGFDDLIEALADLTEAVSDVTVALAVLRSDGCAHFRPGSACS